MEDLDTELLGQLQRWHEEDQYQRIIDAIEAIPQPERGYELTCQLARAYNNLAGPEEAGPLEKSVSLLESIADQGQEDPLWHYRLGYALFYLDREEEALPHFQRAAELEERTVGQMRKATELFRQQYQVLMNTVETASSHMTAELRKMEVSLAQLPRTMDQTGTELKRLASALEKTERREGGEKLKN